MSTDIVPVVPTEAEPEENRPTEVERDSSESTAPMVPLEKQGDTVLNSKMVSGNDHEPKSSVDYIMSEMSEIKQMFEQLLNTLQPTQLPQVGQATMDINEDIKLCSAVTELHEKVQQISEYCAAASVKERYVARLIHHLCNFYINGTSIARPWMQPAGTRNELFTDPSCVSMCMVS